MDGNPVFECLRNNEILSMIGIQCDFVGNKKNKAVADKVVQELGEEIMCIVPDGETGYITHETLATAVRNTNNRIRENGRSAREIITKTDNFTNELIDVAAGNNLQKSSKSQSAREGPIEVGDIVHIRLPRTHKQPPVLDYFSVRTINHDTRKATLQKYTGNQLGSKKYLVKLNDVYLAKNARQERKNSVSDHEQDGNTKRSSSRPPSSKGSVQSKHSIRHRKSSGRPPVATR